MMVMIDGRCWEDRDWCRRCRIMWKVLLLMLIVGDFVLVRLDLRLCDMMGD